MREKVFSSFRQLVLTGMILIATGGVTIGASLDVTIAGSNAPEAVEIKIIKESDMNASSLSKLPERNLKFSATSTDGGAKQKKDSTNLAKLSQFGRGMREKVYSFRQLVLTGMILIATGGVTIGASLDDHITFATHRSGAV